MLTHRFDEYGQLSGWERVLHGRTVARSRFESHESRHERKPEAPLLKNSGESTQTVGEAHRADLHARKHVSE